MKNSGINIVEQSILSSTKSAVRHINKGRRQKRMFRRWIKNNSRLRDAKPLLREPSFGQYREEIKTYWANHYDKPVNPLWHLAFTKATSQKEVRHIPGYVWQEEILPFFNDMTLRPAFLDKNLSDTFLNCNDAPKSVIKCMHGAYYTGNNIPLMRENVEQQLANSGEENLIIKSSRTDNGIGIRELRIDASKLFLNHQHCDLDDLEKHYGQNFIVQEKITQHPDMAKIHPTSLNTIRVVTFRWNNKICLLKTFARFGTAGSIVDNLATGGLACGIDDEGRLYDEAIDAEGTSYSQHPTTHFSFAERTQVPNFKGVCNLALDLHTQIYHFDVVSWDIAVGVDGKPIFLEVNFRGAMDIAQVICKQPLFGDLTEEVLETIRDARACKNLKPHRLT